MRRILPMVVALAAGTVSCGTNPVAGPVSHQMILEDFQFRPPVRDIAAGDSLIWINNDLVPHAVTVEGMTSPPLARGERWGMIMVKGGPLSCPYHPEMRGFLQVE